MSPDMIGAASEEVAGDRLLPSLLTEKAGQRMKAAIDRVLSGAEIVSRLREPTLGLTPPAHTITSSLRFVASMITRSVSQSSANSSGV